MGQLNNFYGMKYLTLILTLTIILGCKRKESMMEQQKDIVEDYIKSYNNFDIDGMTKNLTENFVFKNITNGNVDLKTEGKEEFKKQAESAKVYFKKRKQTIESWEFHYPKVTVKIDYKAILAIDLPNGLKTGDTLELKGISVFEFEDQKIKSIVDKS